MHLPTLLEECELPAELRAAVRELTDLKARTREMGSGGAAAPIARFIEAEFASAEGAFPGADDPDRAAAKAVAAEFFRRQALGAP